MSERVIVGMSGGVDSSVAAYLLKKGGYDVIGVTMQMLPASNISEDAKKVCQTLEIEHYTLNFEKEFKDKVIDYFITSYKNAQTPNPCVVCNRLIKWEALLKRADEMGAKYIATGHYSRIEKNPENGRYTLKLSKTSTKDQTYMLYGLSQEQLGRTLMPLGEYEKADVRKIAESIGLPVANKPDSQDICFIPDGDYNAFLKREGGVIPQKGDFIDKNGNVLGTHTGITNYTIGQRKGLGIALGVPAYVCNIDKEKNTVVLGSNDDLFSDTVQIRDFNCICIDSLPENAPIKANGKLRYTQKMSPCTLIKSGSIVTAKFEQPQRAVTPGQSAVFYIDDYVLGGGIIV